MKSICFFACYFEGTQLPYYVGVYLNELKKHYPEVVFLASNHNIHPNDLQELKNKGIDYFITQNEGFDFGLWYKAFQRYPVSDYEQIVLVNDSCVLFKPLNEFIDWSNKNAADLQGITMSDAIAPHIQSYFLVINKKAVQSTIGYFNSHKVYNDISDVIKNYEVGLSKHLTNNGLSIAAFIDNDGYSGEFSPYYHCINYHLEKGIPLIKKKILFGTYRKSELYTLARMNFNIWPGYYVSKIQAKYGQNLIIDFNGLMRENPFEMGFGTLLKFGIDKLFFKIFRPLYRLIKR